MQSMDYCEFARIQLLYIYMNKDMILNHMGEFPMLTPNQRFLNVMEYLPQPLLQKKSKKDSFIGLERG